MPLAKAAGARCVQRLRWFTYCNSHYVSHFAAFFIDAGAKISVVESCLWLDRRTRRIDASVMVGCGVDSGSRGVFIIIIVCVQVFA